MILLAPRPLSLLAGGSGFIITIRRHIPKLALMIAANRHSVSSCKHFLFSYSPSMTSSSAGSILSSMGASRLDVIGTACIVVRSCCGWSAKYPEFAGIHAV
ncbi:MAG: hypothetical protein BWY82_02946 [Verrucomicrobia bacterium ADurb.Bin474]|nr:MAG: hypothetical protein BWY82_02946 [Verrucomicrobia bacterium ADurb.Bin474]